MNLNRPNTLNQPDNLSKLNNLNKSNNLIKHTANLTFLNAHGKILYGMTNDYMFHAVLQSNNKVLRGLICSLLQLSESDIRSAVVSNPVKFGESVGDKEIRLDVDIVLNDDTLINLEMQVISKPYWPERSVFYLCRSFVSQLKRGQDYGDTKPVIHIGILDYTLFKEYPEFYATYKLKNVKNDHIYSDSLTLSVLDLSKASLATENDKQYRLDQWAALFKSQTWEDLKMISANDEYLIEAAETIYQLNADKYVLKLCQDREEYYNDIRYYQNTIAEKEQSLAEKDKSLVDKDKSLAEKDRSLAEKDKSLTEKDTTINRLLAEIERLKNGK